MHRGQGKQKGAKPLSVFAGAKQAAKMNNIYDGRWMVGVSERGRLIMGWVSPTRRTMRKRMLATATIEDNGDVD